MAHSIHIPVPKNEQDFEIMCAHVYGQIYNCSLPNMYGRKGQKQDGLDILFQKNDVYDANNRIGMQCKHVQKLTFNEKSGDSIIKEVEKADKGKQQISLLVIATSLSSDRNLIDAVKILSDERVKEGKFAVEMQFWDDISIHVNSDVNITQRYQTIDIFSKAFFDKAKEFYEKEKYIASLDLLSDDHEFKKSFNLEDKFNFLMLKAKSLMALERYDELKLVMAELDTFNWVDEQYHHLKILKLLNDDLRLGELMLDEFLLKYPNEVSLKILDIYRLLIIKKENINFDSLEVRLQDHFKLKYYFLMHYNNTEQLENFDGVYSSLSIVQREKPSIILLFLASRINKYRKIRSQENKEILDELLNNFSPKSVKIWAVENPKIRKLIVTCIFTAYIYLEKFSECIKLYDDCMENHIILDNSTLLDILYVCIHIKDKDNFFKISTINYSKLAENKLLILEQLTSFGFYDFVEENIQDLLTEEQEHILACLWRKKLKKNDFIKKIEETDAINFTSYLAIFNIADYLHSLDDKLFNLFNDKIIKLINIKEIDDLENITIYLVQTKQFKKALSYLEKINNVQEKEFFILALFEAYIYTKNFKKAKDLIEKNLTKLKFIDKVINLCYEMASQTHDWSICNKLLTELETNNKDKAWFWSMKLTVAYKIKSRPEQLKAIRDIPELLEGQPETICWLAYQEATTNSPNKARNRIKKLWRDNLNNLQTEQAILRLFFDFLGRADGENPFFDESIHTITKGVAVSYRKKSNEETRIIDIDNRSDGHPELISPTSKLGQALIGKSVGEKFIYNGSFDREVIYEITQIKPLLLEVWHQLIKKTHRVDNPFNFVASLDVDVDTTEGVTDFLSQINEMSKRDHERSQKGLELYKTQPFTLGVLAKFLGKNLLDMVYSWPLDYSYPSLSVDNNYINDQKDENYFQKEFINRAGYVIDCFTLLELKYLSVFDVLKYLNNIYIPLGVYEMLKILLKNTEERAYNQNIKGTLNYNGKQASFLEQDTKEAINIFNHLNEIIDFVESNCLLVTAYGDDNITELDIAIHELLTEHESATLRVCREKKLPLVSFDARLRALAHQANIETVNVDDLIFNLSQLSAPSNSFFSIEKFIKNRTIDEKYLFTKEAVQYCLLRKTNFYSFLQAYFARLMNKTPQAAVDYYLNLINIFTSQDINITIGGLNHLNKIFFVYLLCNEKINFNELKDLLSLKLTNSAKQLSAFTDDIEEIRSITLEPLFISHAFNKPTIHAF